MGATGRIHFRHTPVVLDLGHHRVALQVEALQVGHALEHFQDIGLVQLVALQVHSLQARALLEVTN
jgi:hypothetical protein